MTRKGFVETGRLTPADVDARSFASLRSRALFVPSPGPVWISFGEN